MVPREGEMGFFARSRTTSTTESAGIFRNENAARCWFEEILWSDSGRVCPQCGSHSTYECSHETMPYRCRACRKYFSIRTGTVMAGSPLSLRQWARAIHLDVGCADGASSTRLHRELGITQKSAWNLRRRIREAFAAQRGRSGPESDELSTPRSLDRKSDAAGVKP